MAEDMFFDIKIDGIDKVSRSVSDVIKFMDQAKKKLDEIDRSKDLASAMGGDKDALKKLKNEVKDFDKQWQLFSKQYQEQLQKNGDAITSAFGPGKVKELNLLEQSVNKNFTKMQSKIAGMGAVAEITGESIATSLRESLEKSAEESEKMVKVLASSLTEAEGIADRAGYGSMITAQSEEMEKARMAIQNLEEDRMKLERGFQGSDIVSLMFAKEDPSQFIETIKDLKVNTEALAVQQESYRNKLAGIYTQQREIEEQFRKTNDPDVLKGLQEAYESLTERAQHYVEKLETARKMHRDGLGEAGRGTSGIRQVSQATAMIGETAGTIASLTESLGQVNPAIVQMFTSISAGGQAVSESIKRMQDMRDQTAKWGDDLAIWGKRVKEQNRRLQEGGKELSFMNKIQGRVANSAGMLSKGIGALGAAAGAAGVAIEAITALFSFLDTITGRSSEEIERRISLIDEEVERYKSLNDLVGQGSIEALKERQKSLKAELRASKKHAEMLREQAYQNQTIFDSIRTGVGNFFGDTTVYGATGEKLKEVNDQIRRLNEEIGELSSPTLTDAVLRAKELNATQERAREAIDSLKEREQELYEVRVEAQKAVGDYTKEMRQLDVEFGKETKKIATEREREDRRNLKEHIRELQTQETTYQENIEDMRHEHLQELVTTESDYLKEVAEAASEYNKAVADMAEQFREENTESDVAYQEENIERKIDYDKTLARLEEDYHKDRIQRQKDLHQQLWEAELANDALQYFQLLKQGEKEEKEAQDAHKDALSDEHERYAEESAERKIAYEEEKADRQQNYNEQRQELQESFNEENRLRKEQYEESVRIAKEEFAKTLELEKINNAKERAEIVKNFELRQQEIEDARNEEDLARQQSLSEQRQALDKQLELDLQYYQRREKLLLDFINGLEDVTKDTGDLLSKMANGTVDIAPEGFEASSGASRKVFEAMQNAKGFEFAGQDKDKAVNALNREINRLSESNKLTADEQAKLLEYQEALNKLTSGNSAKILANSDEFYAIQEALVMQQNEQASSFSKTFDNRFKYEDDPIQLQYRESAEAAGKTAEQMPSIYDTHDSFLSDMQLSYSEYGLTTQREAKDQASRYQHIIEREGDENVAKLGEQVREQNQTITEGNAQIQQELELAQDKEIATRQAHFYGVEDETAQHYMKDVAMRESQYANQITQTEEFGKDLEDTTADVYEDALDAAEDSITDGTDNIAMAYDQVNQEIVAGVQKAAASIRTSFSRSQGLGDSRSGRSSARESLSDRIRRFSDSAKNRIFAAEGAFVTRPTELIAGEGESPELVFPFEPSKGIPDNIMQQFGQGFFNGLQTIKSNDSFGNKLPANRQSSDMQNLVNAISRMSSGMDMQIGNLSIGSDISRAEIQSQLRVLMQAVVDTVSKQSQPR